MENRIFSKLAAFAALALTTAFGLSSCDEHNPFPDSGIYPGHVVCTDGRVMSLSEYQASGQKAIAVVFDVPHDDEDVLAYAAYLRDLGPDYFADSVGNQGTSMSLVDMDGNKNTYAMYSQKSPSSPIARRVVDMWQYGQSAYIPSVAQMGALYRQIDAVNATLSALGGQPIGTLPDDSWYWTSTEVRDMQKDKAWLFSTASGTIHETPKKQSHRFRPVITVYASR